MRADGAAGEALQLPGACITSTEVLALLALLACFTMRADGAAGEALQLPGACFTSTEVLALLALLACFTSTEGPALLACFTSTCFTCFTLALLGLSFSTTEYK